MAANLKGRLARIRALGLATAAELGEGGPRGAPAAPEPRAALEPRPRPRPSFLEGWERAGELAWTRTLAFENRLPESLDPSVFAPLHRPRAVLASRARELAPRVPAERLRFFDLETTGLSGGTGTIAFLAAVGRVLDSEFSLTQVFLEDYPGEPAFLDRLLPLLAGDAAIVSYNGRAFDLPLLRTRCVMNGIAPPEPALHVDALFAARRLWRRVHGGASLGLLERGALGIERGEDIPGALIPGAWLAFAKEGDSPLMPLVLSHNAEDVVGLARLVARAQSIFDDPRSRLARADVDRYGLGRTLLAAGREEEGEELLEAAASEGDEGAALLLSLRCRRSRSAEDCLRIAALLPATRRGAVERAKIFERRVGDAAAALAWAREALRLAVGDKDGDEARRRIRRLERKVGRL